MLLRLLAVLISVFLSAAPAFAQDPFNPFDDDPLAAENLVKSDPVTAALVSENAAIAAGQPFTVAFRFEHQKDWHTYWLNSGNVEQSITVDEWMLPDGFSAGPLRFPVPERHTGDDGYGGTVTNYQYGGTNYLLADITPPAEIGATSVKIGAKVRWQHCTIGKCIPAEQTFSIDLPVAAEAVLDESVHAIFEDYRKNKLPAPATGWTFEAISEGDGLQLRITPEGDTANPDLGDLYFFAQQMDLVDASKEQKLERSGDGFILSLPRHPDADAEQPAELPGIVTASKGWLTGGTAPAAFAIDPKIVKAGAAGNDGTAAVVVKPKSLVWILFSAFVGGLILNLMPCVFPVIGLKIMGFVNQAGEDRRKVTLHGLVFAAGVLVSFWVLSAVFFYLREQGEKVGWGFQLQNPWFVYALILVMFVMALNMAGVFEIGTSAIGVGSKLTGHSGMSGTFFSGVLATVVATPCSAPFLGTALGAVAALPTVPFFATFTCIALGLALPYIVLSAFPNLVRKLPRPGPWMESFKQGMSFLLFGTAGYLYWTLSAQIENSLAVILCLAVVAMAFWVYGRWATPVKSKPTRLKAVGIAVLLLGVAFAFGKPDTGAVQSDGEVDPLALVWETWSPERVDELRKAGTPVYIDFTARWCATCQTNKISYKSDEVKQLIKDRNIVLLKASWDKPNPAIKDAIESYGRGAIPVNVLYVPGQEQPEVLPELLTSGVVTDYLKKVPAPADKGL